MSKYLKIFLDWFSSLFVQNEFGMDFSSKGKMPWIEINGVQIADSQFIIEHLSKKLNKDLSQYLSDSDRGIERAFLKMTEESLFW